ncbi:hypothetical protein PVN32_19390 [Bacillus paralicheniformis]|uniref:Uncharacterized protein n=1 Tax=Bacillus paralicheniformis TaxID=1648923 RepID=A0AAW6KI69_9BACI|nr:hypothetical protein [Bacillus paralicheniformis]MDE1454326.1 hypothetical protein [Bacillus paralicheniformis]
MNSNDTVTMLNEEFVNDQTGEKVEGITIIIDGQFKQVLDIIKAKATVMRITLKSYGTLFLRV